MRETSSLLLKMEPTKKRLPPLEKANNTHRVDYGSALYALNVGGFVDIDINKAASVRSCVSYYNKNYRYKFITNTLHSKDDPLNQPYAIRVIRKA